MTIGDQDNKRNKELYNTIWIGAAVNSALVIFKFLAGFFGQSSAMIADAIHSLSDFVTDIIAFIFVRLSGKPIDKDHDYGHGKFETLGTVIIGIVLLIVAIFVFKGAVEKIIIWAKGGQLQAPKTIAFIAAIVSILSKESVYRYTIKIGKRYSAPVVIANAWHHRSDALSSIGTAVGIGGAIMLGANWRVLDPIAAVIVSFFIAKVAINIIVPCLDELLEKSLPDSVEQEIEQIVMSVPGINQPHNLKTRRIGTMYAIEMHIRMDGNMSLNEAHAKASQVEQLLREKYGNKCHISLHVEPNKVNNSDNNKLNNNTIEANNSAKGT